MLMKVRTSTLANLSLLPVMPTAVFVCRLFNAFILSAICSLAFVGEVKSKSASSTLSKASSFAHIVISPADYNRAPKPEYSNSKTYIALPEIARQTAYRYFGQANGNAPNKSSEVQAGKASIKTEKKELSINEWSKSLNVEAQFLKPAGLFVTFSKNGKTRACWGSVYPREANIARETVIATLGALSKEYRFKPLSLRELKDLKIQVTVVRGLEPVSDVIMINPFKDGIMVRSGGRGAVILPGEAVDAYYEFVLAKLKAGIKPKEPCQIYKVRAEIYD